MKAYGRKLGNYLDEENGPPSKCGRKIRGRRADRRIMHQRDRRGAAREIAEQLTVGVDNGTSIVQYSQS